MKYFGGNYVPTYYIFILLPTNRFILANRSKYVYMYIILFIVQRRVLYLHVGVMSIIYCVYGIPMI